MKKIFQQLIILIIICGVSHDGMTQVRTSLFQNYSVEDGLTDKKIHYIYQDSEGWIWIGTDFGIVYYDGYTFNKLSANHPESEILGGARVRVIVEDSSRNKMYIGTETHGLFLLNTHTHHIKQIADGGLSNNSLWDIVRDQDGSFWIATENGLNHYFPDENRFEVYYHVDDVPRSLSNNFVKSLYIDAQNRLWVGTNQGLNQYNREDDNFEHFFLGEQYNYRENEIREIYQDTKGDFWVCTYLTGLHKYDASTGKFKQYVLDETNPRTITARAAVEDNERNLWVGTRGGLYVLDSTRQHVRSYHHNPANEYSLAHNSVIDIFKDKHGDLWIGTRNGVSFLNFNRQAFGHLTSGNNIETELANGEVYCIWEDPDKNIWIGTESGGVHIYHANNHNITTINQKDGLSNDCIKAISPGKSGTVLIGTYLGGLNVYNPATGNITVYQHNPYDPHSLSDDAVWFIFTDSRERTWIGTSNGMDLFDQAKGRFTNYKEQFDVGEVANVYEDRVGRFWIYSNDRKHVTKVGENQQPVHYPYVARTMIEDADSNMWFGTMGDGLVKLNPGTGDEKRFTQKNGLSNNVIYGIVRHNDSILWLSTNHGISRFNIHQETFRNYYLEDGLINSEFNYGAYMKTSDGILLFGGKRGLDFVYPGKIKTNKYAPPVVLTDFKVFNRSVAIGDTIFGQVLLTKHISKTDQITVDHAMDMITFEFAALNYVNSDKNEYLYKLQGFDKSWNDGRKRVATYTNLDAGTYQFIVKASNNDGIWTDEKRLIQLTVTPPYWETIWFKILIIVLVVSSSIAFYFIRVIATERRNKELEKLVKLRTEEISQKNEVLEMQKSELNETNTQLSERKHFIEDQAAELLTQKEELQKTNKQLTELNIMKDKLFSIIAHDLKNPINNILGLSDLLNVRLENMTHDKIKEYIDTISDSARNTYNLLVNLLEWAQSQSGRSTYNPEKVHLDNLIKKNLQFFQEQSNVKNIHVDFEPGNVIAWADENMIDTVIRNLINNAIKFTPRRGNISVTYETSESVNYITVAIADTGVGIPSEVQAGLFNIDSSYSTKGTEGEAGTGLGLMLCAEFIHKNNGEIWVESEENKGTTFFFSLPVL